jgi:hypothetical protein
MRRAREERETAKAPYSDRRRTAGMLNNVISFAILSIEYLSKLTSTIDKISS